MSARKSIINKLGEREYQARVWDARRKPKAGYTSKRFKSRGAAMEWIKETESKLSRGVRTEHAHQLTTVADVCAKWLRLNRPTWKRATYVRAEREVRLMIEPVLGPTPVAELYQAEVEEWRNGLLDTYGPSSVNLAHGTLSAALDGAVRDGLVIGNVARSTKRVSERRKTTAVARTAMPLDAIDAVREALPAPLRIGVTLAFGLGLRPGELFGLTLDRIDYATGEVTIDRQHSRYGKGKGTYGLDDCKHDSARVVPAPTALLDAVKAHVARFGLGDGGVILARPNLKPMTAQAWDIEWRRAMATAELAAGKWTPHSLRHAFGSYQLDAGHAPALVASWMGNTLAVFLDTYAHKVKTTAVAADLDALPRAQAGPNRAQTVHKAPTKRHLKAV